MAFIVTVYEVTEVEVREQDGRYQKLSEEFLTAAEYATLGQEEHRKWKIVNAPDIPRVGAIYTRDVHGYAPPLVKKILKTEKVFEQTKNYLDLTDLVIAVNGIKVMPTEVPQVSK